MSAANASRWIRSNPMHLAVMGVAALVIVIFAWTGLRARSAAADLAAKRAEWEAMAGQLATVQQQFRVPTSTESAALIAESSRMGALAVTPEDRLTLVDMVGRLAEACGLARVRVDIVEASDSAFVAERQIPGATIKPGDYALAVEFAGGFADAQKFVSSLPLSVAVSRLTAARRADAVEYRLVLSVYELDANSGN